MRLMFTTQKWINALTLIGLLCLVYSSYSIVFYLFNKNLFPHFTLICFLKIIGYSFRYDLAAIAITNSLYLVTLLWPFYTVHKPWLMKLRFCFLLIPNIIPLFFELSDWVYFPFNIKRSTADVLFMVGRKSDFWLLLPGFLKAYWFLIPIAIIYIFIFILIFKYVLKMFNQPANVSKGWLSNMVNNILLIGFTVILIRGGLQLKPITTNTPLLLVENVNVPLVINTPFSIINSIGKAPLTEVNYFQNPQTLKSKFNPIKNYKSTTDSFRHKNVVVIIVESLSKEYTGLGSEHSYTPFLDSLANHCIRLNAAYANAYRSIDGLPAILMGVPALMDEPYLNTIYAKNTVDGLGNLLAGEGYYTSFFHGGTNGTMSFNEMASIAGFCHYFGRTEYQNDNDFDGNWGIFDEPFLQFFLKKLNGQPQPFCSAVFTLSSHPPYTIPKKYKSQFIHCKLPIENTLAYTDMSLKKFFNTAQNEAWYKNTLFVITADHAAVMASKKQYFKGVGKAEIPILFFDPAKDSSADINQITQQIDIIPSIMDYLHYPNSFYALGSSIFNNTGVRFSISKQGNVYLFICKNKGYYIYDNKVQKVDSLKNRFINPLTINDHNPEIWWHEFGKAFMQTYTNNILQNKTQIYNR